MTSPAPTPIRYREDLEHPRQDEAELIDKLVAKLHGNNVWAYKKYRHAIRDAHAKSHGILIGELTVDPDLPEELAQGLFARAATYPVFGRLSSTSGALRHDRLRGIRGLGLKVLGVEGPRLQDDGATTQDFLLVTHREFPFKDAHAYLVRGMPLAWLLARLPDRVMMVVQWVLARVKPVVHRFGGKLPVALELFVEPNIPILGNTFFSSAPIRYGDYVAKFCLAPLSPSVKVLSSQLMPDDAGPEAFRDMVVEFFRHDSAVYELRVQLCTDPVTMPIEDATVAWPESVSPHRRVATVTFPAQDAYGDKRRIFGDDVLSFNAWTGLAAHRPLGSINRLKLKVYEASSTFRHEKNHQPLLEPVTVDVPE